MRSFLSGLFGAKPTQLSRPSPEPTQRHDMLRDTPLQSDGDVVAGYSFCATLQLRTPLRVLKRHGEIHAGLVSTPPVIAREMWEGIWIPKTKTFRELGLDIDEPAIGTMASDIGPVPMDGGDYLKFLTAVRQVVEVDQSIQDRRKSLADILATPSFGMFVKVHGGKEKIMAQFFPSFLSTIPRVSEKLEADLVKQQMTTPEAIAMAPDKVLLAISGLGPSLLGMMRKAASQATNPSSRYIDRVVH